MPGVKSESLLLKVENIAKKSLEIRFNSGVQARSFTALMAQPYGVYKNIK